MSELITGMETMQFNWSDGPNFTPIQTSFSKTKANTSFEDMQYSGNIDDIFHDVFAIDGLPDVPSCSPPPSLGGSVSHGLTSTLDNHSVRRLSDSIILQPIDGLKEWSEAQNFDEESRALLLRERKRRQACRHTKEAAKRRNKRTAKLETRVQELEALVARLTGERDAFADRLKGLEGDLRMAA